MTDRMIYFDNGFLQRFLENLRCLKQQKWQKFYSKQINKIIPYKIIITPFKFLEMLGVLPEERYVCDWRYKSSYDHPEFDQDEFNKITYNRLKCFLKEGVNFYSKQEKLKNRNYRDRIKYTYETRIGRQEFQKLFARDILNRMFQVENWEDQIYEAFTFADIQNSLLKVSNSSFYRFAQFQTLSTLITANRKGHNDSFVRLIRQIYLSIEGLHIKGGKTVFNLKSHKDNSDVDWLYFALFGAWDESVKKVVHIFTCDSYEDTKRKLEILKTILRGMYELLSAKKIKLPNMKYGYVYCAKVEPFKNYYNKIKVKYLKEYNDDRFTN